MNFEDPHFTHIDQIHALLFKNAITITGTEYSLRKMMKGLNDNVIL